MGKKEQKQERKKKEKEKEGGKESNPFRWKDFHPPEIWLNNNFGSFDSKRKNKNKNSKRFICYHVLVSFQNVTTRLIFFAQSVLFKLASPQAAQLSLYFYKKTSSVALPWGTWIKDARLRG